jgi:hypothetical protein
MKLAALYLVYNGLELLEGSIDQIYSETDVIILGWQSVSHYGERSSEVEPFVNKLKKKYKKVVLFEFKPRPNPKKSSNFAKQEERRKINQMIKVAQGLSCTHFFISATDHYYNSSQFVNAKEKAKQYDVTASKMYTYFKKPEWRLNPIETYYMPFICKLRVNQTYSADTHGKWNVYVDPALCILPNDSFYEFKEDELMMHHYSFVRNDVQNKLRNAAARRNFNNKIDDIIKEYEAFDGTGKVPYYINHTIEVVDNFFDI